MRVVAVVALLLAGGLCIGGPAWATHTECTDRLDQDADGLVDFDDGDCAGQFDEIEGIFTLQYSAKKTRQVLRSVRPVSRPRVSCRRLARVRCRFSLRGGRSEFPYEGVMMLWPLPRADGGEFVSMQYAWYRGRCGSLGRALPYDIRVFNMPCGQARQRIRDWYSHGQSLRPYHCLLRAAPASARCKASFHGDPYGFTFKYPE